MLSGASIQTRRPSPSGATVRTRPTASTWPCTTWPPSWSPTRSEGSRFTSLPGSRRPSAVRERVSGTTSKASRPSGTSTTVRQTPATATESPTTATSAVSGAATTSRELSKASTVPSSRTMPVNMRRRLRLVQVRLQQHVFSRGLCAEVEELERGFEVAEDTRPVPCQDGRDEEEQLVDDTGGEKRRGERRPALQQQRPDALRRERAQLLVEWAGAQLEFGPLRQRAAPEGESPRLAGGRDVPCVERGAAAPHGPQPAAAPAQAAPRPGPRRRGPPPRPPPPPGT